VGQQCNILSKQYFTRLTIGLLITVTMSLPALAAKTTAGKLQVTPSSIKFSATADGNTQIESLKLENVGESPLTGSVEAASGTGFDVTSGNGGYTLNPTQTLTVEVSFTPSKAGKYAGKLPITAGSAKKTIALSGVGTPVSSGTVFLFGGVPNTINIIALSEQFTSVTEKFSSIPEMSDSRGFIHEAPYLNPSLVTGAEAGDVFISGGQDNADNILGTTELYDPASNSFSDGPSIDPRAEHTATFFTSGPLAGQVLITGGLELEGGTRIALNDQQLYDPATNGVSSTGLMNDARGQHTATLLNNGLVLVTGGYDENFDPASFNEATATAELYDPSNQGFSCVPTGASSSTTTSDCPDVMSSPRWNHRATLLADGTVLVTGGTPTDSGTREGTNSADLYDPTSNSFSALPNMNNARQGHSATLIEGCNCSVDGEVLIAGGQDQNTNITATAELYDPTTKTFTSVGNMTLPRAEHQAVAFTTGDLAGSVLIVGGYPKADEQGTNTAELFNPITKTFKKISSMKSDRYEFPLTLVPPS
jgi:Abnormal spindle-like microcephaly-assoc'd, ASPM-SPD-2-Hydin/Kelch motif/Galactose oxidase, central domain